VSVPPSLRVAYTLEQCWHDVPGGTAVSALEVARRLVERADVELVLVAGRHRDRPSQPFEPPGPVHQLALARPWLYEAWNRTGRPRVESATGRIDVCHSTAAIPAPSRAPQVVTVHDVAFVHHPERFSRHGVRVMRAGLERCRGAALVLVPTDAVRGDLVELGFHEERVRTVRWGVEAQPVSGADVAAVRRRYRLPDRFVLFVGTLEPRKNLQRLAAATAGLPDLPLVVAGAPGWGDGAPAAAHVSFLGFVPREHLAALYAACTVFAYPSLEEGFGMPIAEAMAQGAPVVTSRGGATEETAGGAAVLVDPADTGSIEAGIRDAVARADELVVAGRSRATLLDWDATVTATVTAYRDAAS
jgi:glycosyltransferase involved in cell wall biosynthesis